jgi:hypothetical protein
MDTATCGDNTLAVDRDDSEASELSNLAKVALADFIQSGEIPDLNTAVELHREALRLTLPMRCLIDSNSQVNPGTWTNLLHCTETHLS